MRTIKFNFLNSFQLALVEFKVFKIGRLMPHGHVYGIAMGRELLYWQALSNDETSIYTW